MLVLELATDALRLCGVIGETQTPSAEQGQSAVTRLNDLMFQWEEKGVDLGWNSKATTADTVVLPLGHVKGIKAQLAELLASDYGVLDSLPQTVIRDAEDSRNMLQRQVLQLAFSRPNLNSMPMGESGGGLLDIASGTIR